MVILFIMMAALEERGQRSSQEVGGHIWEWIQPPLRSNKLPVWVPALALQPCVVKSWRLSETPFPHCKMSGFRGAGSVSGVVGEVVLTRGGLDNRAGSRYGP